MLTSGPLIQNHNFGRVDAPAVQALVPYLGEWPALNPHEEHGGPHNGVHGDHDEPDDGFHHPALAKPEQGESKRCLAPGSGQDREKTGKDGNERHLGKIGWVHVVEVLAIVETHAHRGGGSGDD